MFKSIGSIIAGASSAFVTGGHLLTSSYHFGIFLMFLLIGVVLGAIADQLISK